MKLIEKSLIKEYYIRLSDIIRTYIENRYRIFAMDRTTWELFQEMKSKKIERLHADKINNFLEECDMVKFAKYTPSHKEIEEIYKKAEEIINITTSEITKIQETITKQ
jgi:ribosomal protein S3AE